MLRKDELNICLFASYLGYSQSEIKQMRGKEDEWPKLLYHALRLIMEVEVMLERKGPRVYFEGKDRDFLLGIRNKKQKRNEYLMMYQEKYEEIEKKAPYTSVGLEDSLKPVSKSTGKRNEGFEILNAWLVEVRLELLKEESKSPTKEL